MSLPPSPGSPASPSGDRAALLLEAVRRRDGWAAAQLLQRWVHRHGVASLEHFCRTDLQRLQGPEAAGWLLQRIEAPLEPAPASASAMPAPAPAAAPEAVPLPEPLVSDAAPLPAAPLPEPGSPVAPQAAGEKAEGEELAGEAAAPVEHAADPPAAPPVLAGEPSVRLEVAAIDPWLSPAERPAVPAEPSTGALIPDDSPAEAPEDPLEAAPEAAEPTLAEAEEEEGESVPMSAGLRRLGRLGSRMWSSLESLGRGRDRSEEEPRERSELEEVIEESVPEPGPDEALQDPLGSHDLDSSEEKQQPASSTSPLDAWPASAPAAAPAEASLPPRPAGHRPAPSPAPLQDLRAWLPDADDTREFPRAS